MKPTRDFLLRNRHTRCSHRWPADGEGSSRFGPPYPRTRTTETGSTPKNYSILTGLVFLESAEPCSPSRGHQVFPMIYFPFSFPPLPPPAVAPSARDCWRVMMCSNFFVYFTLPPPDTLTHTHSRNVHVRKTTARMMTARLCACVCVCLSLEDRNQFFPEGPGSFKRVHHTAKPEAVRYSFSCAILRNKAAAATIIMLFFDVRLFSFLLCFIFIC